jgi:putative transposase
MDSIYKPIHPLALFRYSVLGCLINHGKLSRGELRVAVKELAEKTYEIPNSKHVRLSPYAIERWYYAWKRNGIDGLTPKIRSDKNRCHLSEVVKEALLSEKKDNPARSINSLIKILEMKGIIARSELSRTTVHRFLKQHKLSKRTVSNAPKIQRLPFVAEKACDLWHADVMHGPKVMTAQGMRKVYLVSLLDDASRFLVHTAFCLGETALDIEGVLKQAILKSGLPDKIILDNGSAYRSHSLQSICVRLQIKLVYCPAYEPQAKGKIEKFHSYFRSSFLTEINLSAIQNLEDLNARLWAWVDQIYHVRSHVGLPDNCTPLERWRKDLIHIRQLGAYAHNFDAIFYHRHKRKVYKDCSISFEGKLFEVSHEYCGETVNLVIDPSTQKAICIEELKTGKYLGPASPVDPIANNFRKRQRPNVCENARPERKTDLIELALQEKNRSVILSNKINLTAKKEQ